MPAKTKPCARCGSSVATQLALDGKHYTCAGGCSGAHLSEPVWHLLRAFESHDDAEVLANAVERFLCDSEAL